MEPPPRKPRYFWQPAGLGRNDDFQCEVDGKTVARMYLHHTGVWTWFMNASWLSGINGAANTPLAAACEAEDAYDKAVEIEARRRAALKPQ